MTALNQVIKSNDLIPIVKTYYDLRPPICVELINAGFNHSYRVKTGDRLFVLRIYLNNKYYIRSSDDFRFELELLEYLKRQGIPVASPIKNNRSEFLSCCDFYNTTRYLALFNYAAGQEITLELKPE